MFTCFVRRTRIPTTAAPPQTHVSAEADLNTCFSSSTKLSCVFSMDFDSDSSSEADSVDDIIERHRQFKDLDEEDDPEGVLDLEEDDEDDDEDLFDDKFGIQVQKQDMASDIEDEEEDDIEKFLPDAKKWGSKKSDYYDTNYVDVGKRKPDQQEDEDAEAEEEEALAIQKRLLLEMKDLDQMDLELDGHDQAEEMVEPEDAVEKVQLNVSSMNEREKDRLLRRLHPELLPLIDDFKKYTEEAANVLEPIVKFAATQEGGKMKQSSGYHVVHLKFHLVGRYITLLSHYFLLKAKQTDTKKHPLVSKLLNFKKLITEVETVIQEKGLKKDIKTLAEKVTSGETIIFDAKEPSEKELKALEDIDFERVLVAQQQKTRTDMPFSAEGETSDSRRGITFEMSKNKGMTVKKKKELRNPRVKHRMKYKKAQSRRRGQVREPRKEVTKYAGELRGIKTNVRSIKFNVNR